MFTTAKTMRSFDLLIRCNNDRSKKVILQKGSQQSRIPFIAHTALKPANLGYMGDAERERFRHWFERVDADKTGYIDARELKAALSAGNLRFPDSVVEQMIRMHDSDRNGTMSFEEFVALNKFLSNVQNAYFLSERGKGYLVLDDVYEALKECGYVLDQPAFYTVCESFDQSRKGMFRLDDFISLCIFIQSARNLFKSFDTVGEGRVTLDFNQFVYCAANCRI